MSHIGLAKWPRNRLLGIRALNPESVQLSPAVAARGESRLALNVKTAPEGYVRASLLDGQTGSPFPGYEPENCEVLTGDHLETVVRWRRQSALPKRSEHPEVLAQIELRRATLYAFDFTLAEG